MSKKKAEAVEAKVSGPVEEIDIAAAINDAECHCVKAICDLTTLTGRRVARAELVTRTTLDNESGRTRSEQVFEIELSE